MYNIKIIVVMMVFMMLIDEYYSKEKAYSFQHNHGPVEGGHQKITWKDKHGHHHHDYVSEPHYKYSYGVKDGHTHDLHGAKEYHDGKTVHGEYLLHEPGGNIRTVKYYVDDSGFHAEVHNSHGWVHHEHGDDHHDNHDDDDDK